jgi:hypothetical protein
MPYNKGGVYLLEGEVNPEAHIIYVYSCEYNDAMHTLMHEFFEAMLDPFVKPYVEMYNHSRESMEQAFMKIQYTQKEAKIERMIKAEVSSRETELKAKKPKPRRKSKLTLPTVDQLNCEDSDSEVK